VISRTAAALAVAILVVALAAIGCASPSPSSSGATPSPTASRPPPGPTDVPTPGSSLPPFACGTTVRRPGSVPIALMSGMDVGNEAAGGRIAFTFRPAGNVAAVPEVEIRPVSPPFVKDPSGLPLEVRGTSFLQVVLRGGTALDANVEPTYGGPFDVAPDGSPIVEVKRAGDFEAVSTFVVGLDGPPCVRILPPDGTSRVVIEIETE